MSGWSDAVRLPAPAKINLFLHVTGRRPDGYHVLQTVFRFLDLADDIWLAPAPPGRIERGGGLEGLAPEDDLAVRAARALLARTGVAAGARIVVEKRIPAGAGLGGGSSDAATVLVGLNRLWGTALGVDALAALGLTLGADVPVFVRGHAAWAEGVGEAIVPVHLDPTLYLVVVPPAHVATAAVFGDVALTRNCPPAKMADFAIASMGGDCGAVESGVVALSCRALEARTTNVCEPVTRRLHPVVGEAIDRLRAAGLSPRLSGTGGAVFAPVDTASRARTVAKALPGDWLCHVARGLDRSPLHEALAGAR